MDILVLGLFCLLLVLCVGLDISILYALVAGLILFLVYGKRKGFSWYELKEMSVSGIKTVRNILISFLLIGMLTALWRCAGTISSIVCYATLVIRPSVFLVMCFLLNCLVSVLTGTAFGTAATMGVICATMGSAMHVEPILVGGAILSGVFFGDRCSPVSTSALLVAEVTKTNIFENLKRMVRSAWVPFLISCLFYAGMGMLNQGAGSVPDLRALFQRELSLGWITLLPAVVIMVLSLFQVNVKLAMSASILTAMPICIFVQGTPVVDFPQILLTGYQAEDPEVASMLNGGGIFSMVKVGAIVCLSSSYSGIFQKTGLLDHAREMVKRCSERTTEYTAMVLTAIVASMIACNQTLAVMLTHQLCGRSEEDNQRTALDLEDSAVVLAPLVPWSIAGAVPLASVGAPGSSLFFACFLYLLPMWRLLVEFIQKRRIAR